MDSMADKGSWQTTGVLETTSDPNLTVSAMSEDIPTLTVTTMAGLVVVMLVAIAAVFLLGVLIDCRQQRLLEKKMGEAKRSKSQRRVTRLEDDSASIANNMEDQGMSAPPTEVVTHVP